MTDDIASQLIERLQETERKPVRQIKQIVEICGAEFALFMAENAETIFNNEGMTVQDGSRKRSLGGVFFYIVRGSVPPDVRRVIFPVSAKDRMKPSKYPELDWDNRHEVLQTITNIGEVDEVNISIKGKPDHIERRAHLVVVALEGVIGPEQTFPRGMPPITEEPSRFFIYISENQWEKHVAKAFTKNRKPMIHVDGACFFDGESGGIGIYARAVRVIREPKKSPDAEKPKPVRQKPPANKSSTSTIPPTPPGEDARVSEVDPEIAKKLRPLYGARRMFQKRLEDIKAQPADKQSGLKAAEMMLLRTEQQIAMLEKQAGIEPTAEKPTE